MKIALVTIHRANNYGAVLQAFATQKVLARFGSVRILDYRNAYINQTLELVRLGRGARAVLRFGKDVLRFVPRRRVIGKFLNFIESRLDLYPFDPESVDGVEKDFDVFVTGSDQVWNPTTVSYDHEYDRIYLLDFVRSKKKISYASSMGSYVPNKEREAQLKQMLSSYDCLSARESGTAEKLSRLTGKPVSHLLDPTLLLDRNEWLSSLQGTAFRNNDDYVLVFALKKDPLFKRAVRDISERLGKRVLAIDQESLLGFKVDEHLLDVGPDEFINIFGRAKFVITNSFHGTAFAANFGVPFAAVMPPSGGNRVESWLDAIGLSERLVRSDSDSVRIAETSCDFLEAHRRLEQLRGESLRYLKEALVP